MLQSHWPAWEGLKKEDFSRLMNGEDGEETSKEGHLKVFEK